MSDKTFSGKIVFRNTQGALQFTCISAEAVRGFEHGFKRHLDGEESMYFGPTDSPTQEDAGDNRLTFSFADVLYMTFTQNTHAPQRPEAK